METVASNPRGPVAGTSEVLEIPRERLPSDWEGEPPTSPLAPSAPTPETSPAPASDRARRLRVTEVFYSVQGESSHAGKRSVFVRLTGCHLRCSWCDTEYSFHGGQWLSFDDLIAQITSYGCKLVEITGGEPLLQKNVLAFMRELLERGYTVMLETSGALDIAPVDPRVIKIVDVKCPGSGESHRNFLPNLEKLAPHDEVKFVIAHREDYDFTRQIIQQYQLDAREVLPLVSAVHGQLSLKTLTEWVLEDRLDVRFQVQLHKYIWGPDVMGV